jgi:hypothetical protein
MTGKVRDLFGEMWKIGAYQTEGSKSMHGPGGDQADQDGIEPGNTSLVQIGDGGGSGENRERPPGTS